MNWEAMTPDQKDVLIAEKVMGYETGVMPSDNVVMWNDSGIMEPIPPYTQSLDAAWLVVEKMLARQEEEYYTKHFEWRGPSFKPPHQYLTNEGYPLGTTCWYVYLCVNGRCRFICAKTPQEAICLAALQAVGVDFE